MKPGSGTRQAHWISGNRSERVPHRWIVMDTESRSKRSGKEETQEWRLGAAVFWRTDLKRSDARDERGFQTPGDMWDWITGHCSKGRRTILWCHNLGHDARISRMFSELPARGFRLEWFNLSQDVSTIVWRSERGTLVCVDLFTWLPVPLSDIGGMVGTAKLPMPRQCEPDTKWLPYCLNDVHITEMAVRLLIEYVAVEHLGNWQPTGAGMAYAMWRHKYLDHKILVHDDASALDAERAAMHTGRAEAWKHGDINSGVCAQFDMRMAYCTIAAECDMPVKLKYHDGSTPLRVYQRLSLHYRCLARVSIRTDVPCVPCRHDGRTIWPTGEFQTWLWDAEVDLAIQECAQVKILEMYRYTKAPILKRWAEWSLAACSVEGEHIHPVIRTWIKHASRALIGRISLKSRTWEPMGDNPMGITGISLETDTSTGEVHRLMHAGEKTLLEGEVSEGDSSLPQVTGYIMSECRARLWKAMRHTGLDRIVHVDTDAFIAIYDRKAGVPSAIPGYIPGTWEPKGAWGTVTVYGPRNYRTYKERKTAGVPKKADEIRENVFRGDRWESTSTALRHGRPGKVIVRETTWKLSRKDSRRLDTGDGSANTVPIRI